MFARPIFRCGARALRQQPLRRYATETKAPSPEPSQKPPAGNSTAALLAVAVGIAGFGTYYIFGRDSSPAAVKNAAGAAAVAAGLQPKKALLGGDQGFVSLQLEDVETVNHNTKRLRFKLPEDDMVSGVHVASAILTKFKPNDSDKPVIRPYTPISDEGDKGHMDLLIKKYEGGPMSTYLHDLVPGQKLDVKGPLPKYPWSPNKHSHIALIAGGTGITPMYQLLRAIFNNPGDKTKVTLVFGNVTEADVLLKKQLAELENTYPQRFRAFYVLEKAPKGWAGHQGFITKELLKTVLPEPKEENVKVFVCGPPGMMKAISGPKVSPKDQGDLSGALNELGYDKNQVYKF